MKPWVEAVAGFPGVRGCSVQGQISRGTWEIRQGSSVATRGNRQREYITVSGSCRKTERPVVAGKSGNADGAKGASLKTSCCKRKGEPLGKPHYGRTGAAGETL